MLAKKLLVILRSPSSVFNNSFIASLCIHIGKVVTQQV